MGSTAHSLERVRQEADAHLLVHAIPALVWSGHADGSADFFNQRSLEYTGLSLDEALGWGWKAVVHPDDLPNMLAAFEQAVRSGKPFEVEGRFRRRNGEFRRFLFRASPLLNM